MAVLQFDPNRRLGKLQCSTSVLEGLLCLPDGYKIVRLFMETDQIISVIITSEALPEIVCPDGEARDIPLVQFHVMVDTLPGHPEYRKITTEIKGEAHAALHR